MGWDWGNAFSGGAQGAGAGSMGGPYGAAIGGGIGFLSGGLSGGGGQDSPFGGDPFGSSKNQGLLPKALRKKTTGPILQDWITQLGALIRNPGGLSPTVSQAILPRLAMESQSIAQNYRNMQGEQAGAAARSNLPVSIKNALASALDIAQERAQRDARFAALAQSDALRRQDIGQGFDLVSAIRDFLATQKGLGIQASGQQYAQGAQDKATNLAFLGSLMQSLGSSGAFNRRSPATTPYGGYRTP